MSRHIHVTCIAMYEAVIYVDVLVVLICSRVYFIMYSLTEIEKLACIRISFI